MLGYIFKWNIVDEFGIYIYTAYMYTYVYIYCKYRYRYGDAMGYRGIELGYL